MKFLKRGTKYRATFESIKIPVYILAFSYIKSKRQKSHTFHILFEMESFGSIFECSVTKLLNGNI